MKAKVVVIVGLVILLASCATVQVQPSSVFDEMKKIVRAEGVLDESGELVTAREFEGKRYQINFYEEKDWILIQVIEPPYSCAVGCFSGSQAGEYLKGVFEWGNLIAREEVTKEEAEKIAREFLESFKKGRKPNSTDI